MTGLTAIEAALAASASAVVATRPRRRGTGRPILLNEPLLLNEPEFGVEQQSRQYFPFSIGGLGNFPYCWESQATLRFNSATYAWITAGAMVNTGSISQEGNFVNRFLRLLSTVSYALSCSDQKELTAAQIAISRDQGQLLRAWKAAFNSLPSSGGTPPIDLVIDDISKKWADPPIDPERLSASTDVRLLLNKIPAGGEPVLQPLQQYLNSVSRSVPLVNSVSRNNGLRDRALEALQSPSLANGAVELEDGNLAPSFLVLTPVEDILRGLSSNSMDAAARLTLAVTPKGEETLDAVVNGGEEVNLMAAQLLQIAATGGGDLLSAALGTSSAKITIAADYRGVTTVDFAPAQFWREAPKNWYWIEPIIDALRNSGDRSGFRFSPVPELGKGKFGYIESAIISRYPSITIEMPQPVVVPFLQAVNMNAGAELIFLGRTLGVFGEQMDYTAVRRDPARSEITLQPKIIPTTNLMDARAYVLGVRPRFPVD